jgi:hypothetical protein
MLNDAALKKLIVQCELESMLQEAFTTNMKYCVD